MVPVSDRKVTEARSFATDLRGFTQIKNSIQSKNQGDVSAVICGCFSFSDPHGHDDVAVLVVFAFGGAKLAGGLGVFEFQANVAGTRGF